MLAYVQDGYIKLANLEVGLTILDIDQQGWTHLLLRLLHGLSRRYR